MSNTSSLAEVVEVSIDDFLAMKAAPGHRDSEARALRAVHLHKLLPEHHEVEIAEYSAEDGSPVRETMTGNTRRQVWKCGLSDCVPTSVRARVYRMKDAAEVRERMLLHDSREAAWTAKDHKFRAMNMTFGTEWEPRSKPLKSGAFTVAVRHVDCMVYHNRWTPDSTTKVELVMANWGHEIKLLDDILDTPLADGIRIKRPFTWGFLAACLLLLRYRPVDNIRTFVRGILNDAGSKNEDRLDGIYIGIENLGKKGDKQDMVFKGLMGSYDLWEQKLYGNLAKARKFDPLAWTAKERDARREAIKSQKAEAAE